MVIEHPNFSTELILTNFSDEAKVFDVRFVADAIAMPDKTATVKGDLIPPGGQAIIPDAVHMLRESGAEGIGPRGRTIAGAAFFTAPAGGPERGGDRGPGRGLREAAGSTASSTTRCPTGRPSKKTAWIDALQQNEENRSNLALVNTGEVDDQRHRLRAGDLRWGNRTAGQHRHRPEALRPEGWRQINGILS